MRRTGLTSTLLFLGLNGWRMTASQDQRFDLIIAIATDQIRGVADIAAQLRALTTAR